ncbi:hypothetical protein CPT_Machias_066 [Staphylococcus phage Machias]|nr:hypothetical protein CPT_Machias_066 [Staphylococcus phage Machias]
MKSFEEVKDILLNIKEQTDENSFPNEAYDYLVDIEKYANIDSFTNDQIRKIVKYLVGIKDSLERYEIENEQSEMAINMVLHKIETLKDRYNTLYINNRIPNNGYIDSLYKEDFSSNKSAEFNFKQLTVALAESPAGSKLERKAVINFLMEGSMNYLNEAYDDDDDEDYLDGLDSSFETSKEPKVAEKNLNKLIGSVKKATASSKNMDDKQLAKANRIRFVRAILTAIIFCIGLEVSAGVIGKAKTALLGLLVAIVYNSTKNSELNRLIIVLEERIQSLENKIDSTDNEQKRKELRILKSDLEGQLKKANFQKKAIDKTKNAISRGDVNDSGNDYGY